MSLLLNTYRMQKFVFFRLKYDFFKNTNFRMKDVLRSGVITLRCSGMLFIFGK